MEPKKEVQNYYNNKVVSVGDWVVTFILLAIPIVNLVMLFVWGFGDSTPLSKKNYARAVLILMAIGMLLGALMWGSMFTFFREVTRYY